MKTSMCSLFSLLLLVTLTARPSTAWGGLFNRFSPEMLSNLGYGGHGYGSYRAQPLLQEVRPLNGEMKMCCALLYLGVPSLRETGNISILGNKANYQGLVDCERFQSPVEVFQELQEDEEPCYGKKCTANEHCCPGAVCVDMDGIVGSCLFAYGLKQGELCRRDNDCETGLLCAESGEGRTCQPPITNKKQYSEDCTMSSDCDISKGLCCQLQRRHRQAPRKVCSYFKDPLICIGPVATDQVKDDIEHTAGEKRLTGKAPYNHIRRK